MFNADPHPAEDGFVAVQETYSRTIICSTGLPTRTEPRYHSKATVPSRDRLPAPNRGFVRIASEEEPRRPVNGGDIPVVAVIGANETSRESQLATRMADCLASQGLRVAVTRLTGTRQTVLRDSCHWISTRDLSDYGYVSTRTCDPRELDRLFDVQINDVAAYSPDVIVAHLEGTLWRQDVRSMLQIIGRRPNASAAVLSATEPGAALLGHQMVSRAGLRIAALWTPRADSNTLRRDSRVRALDLPVCGRGNAACAARAITNQLRLRWIPIGNGLLDHVETLQVAA